MTDYQTARVSLGVRLRELRGEAGLSGKEMAARAGWHPSKVSRLEHGRQTAAAEDLRTWARLCGRQDATEGLLAQRQSLETHYTSWRRRLSGGNQARQQNAVDLENQSRRFRIFESVCIPGLLQTPAYARYMIWRAVQLYGTPGDVESGVHKRMERRRIRRPHTGLPNAALGTGTAYPAASCRGASEQLEDLVDNSNVDGAESNRPPGSRLSVSPMHGFWIYDDDRVLVETISAELCLTDGEAIASYVRVFDELSRSALRGPAAIRLVESVRHDLLGGGRRGSPDRE